ncbi:hypothetical protein HDV00_005095 [Rhizophlyctis rosea]|nr:hypothetical protein HDV00_005095 [Rhizophlyctis rosea]
MNTSPPSHLEETLASHQCPASHLVSQADFNPDLFCEIVEWVFERLYPQLEPIVRSKLGANVDKPQNEPIPARSQINPSLNPSLPTELAKMSSIIGICSPSNIDLFQSPTPTPTRTTFLTNLTSLLTPPPPHQTITASSTLLDTLTTSHLPALLNPPMTPLLPPTLAAAVKAETQMHPESSGRKHPNTEPITPSTMLAHLTSESARLQSEVEHERTIAAQMEVVGGKEGETGGEVGGLAGEMGESVSFREVDFTLPNTTLQTATTAFTQTAGKFRTLYNEELDPHIVDEEIRPVDGLGPALKTLHTTHAEFRSHLSNIRSIRRAHDGIISQVERVISSRDDTRNDNFPYAGTYPITGGAEAVDDATRRLEEIREVLKGSLERRRGGVGVV